MGDWIVHAVASAEFNEGNRNLACPNTVPDHDTQYETTSTPFVPDHDHDHATHRPPQPNHPSPSSPSLP